MPEAAKFLQGMNGFDGRDPVAASEARKAVLEPGIAISGPVAPLPVGGRILVVRRAIFVPASEPNENFGRPDATNPLCGPGCDYNATTGMAFWGFAAGLVDIDAFLASKASSKELSNPLLTLDELGLSYTLVNADGVTVASSARAPRSAVQAEMLLPGTRVSCGWRACGLHSQLGARRGATGCGCEGRSTGGKYAKARVLSRGAAWARVARHHSLHVPDCFKYQHHMLFISYDSFRVPILPPFMPLFKLTQDSCTCLTYCLRSGSCWWVGRASGALPGCPGSSWLWWRARR